MDQESNTGGGSNDVYGGEQPNVDTRQPLIGNVSSGTGQPAYSLGVEDVQNTNNAGNTQPKPLVQPNNVVSSLTVSATVDQNQNAAAISTKTTGRKKLKKMLLYIAGGVFGVFTLVFAAQIFMKDDRVGTLVEARTKGISFMRPASWIEKTSNDGYTYYTEKGEDINNAELAVVLGTQTGPVDYASLSEADKARVKGAFTSRPQALSNSFTSKDCAEPGEVKNSEQQREGYDLAYLIEATCNKLQAKDAKGQVKIVFGWKGKDLQIFAVIADDQLWQQNHEKLEKILASAKPQ